MVVKRFLMVVLHELSDALSLRLTLCVCVMLCFSTRNQLTPCVHVW